MALFRTESDATLRPAPARAEIRPPPRPAFRIDAIDLGKAVQFMAEIRDIQLSQALLGAIVGYEKVGHRNSFLWRWVRRGVEITTMACVPKERFDHVCDTKVFGVVFDVLLDDVADYFGQTEFLESLIALTERSDYEAPAALSAKDRELFDYTRFVWGTIQDRIRGYPRYEEFREVFEFDFRQLLNSMRYSNLIKTRPWLMNLNEHDAYLPHNMHMVVSSTIDLMASPGFDRRELGLLRKAVLYAQYMGRIGNLVTTWEREIRERDFSSGIFPLALHLGVLTLADLEECDQEKITRKIRAANLERRFLRRWEELREKIIQIQPRLRSVDLGKLLDGLETLIQLHLGSRGLK
jgi:hypothetical protein